MFTVTRTLTDVSSDRNRFFQLALRKPRAPPKKAAQNERAKRGGRGKADEEELLRNLALLENKGTLAADGSNDTALPTTSADGSTHDEEDDTIRVEKPVSYEFPHPRFNAQLAIADDVLYIYGGTYEKGDREFTFDELYSIDLGKLDGAREVYRRELEDWQGSEDESSSDDDEDGFEDEDDDEDENGSADDTGKTTPSTPATSLSTPGSEVPNVTGTDAEADIEPEPETEPEVKDTTPHPRPFESLRDFFTRSSHAWQDAILEEMKYKRGDEAHMKGVKEMRKTAFERAEAKWWDCREEIQKLEDEQEEAGIGEVVSIADRGGGEGGGGRRR